MATYQVAASADDCLAWKNPSSIWQFGLAYGYVQVGRWRLASNQYTHYGSGLRFLNVTIPPTAMLTSAVLRIRCAATNASTVVRSRVEGEKSLEPVTFTTLADYQGRGRTTASVDWDIDSEWAAGTDYDSPDISTVINEVIQQSGWASGNPIVLFWDDHDARSDAQFNTWRRGESYDGSATYAPKLIVTWRALLPSDTMSRVTSLIHRYNRGVYSLEILLGDVVADFNIPEIDPKIKKSYESKEATEAEKEQAFLFLEETVPPSMKRKREEEQAFLFGEESMRERRPEGLSPWEKVTPWREEAGQTFPSEVGKVWRKLTPWKEEKGETFGAEVIERARSFGGWIGGLFK